MCLFQHLSVIEDMLKDFMLGEHLLLYYVSVSASQCHGGHAEGFHVGRASLTGGQPRRGKEQDS